MTDPFEPPGVLHQVLEPIKTLARLLDFALSGLRADKHVRRNITLVCISDTHCLVPDEEIPYGDVLIHAGDLTVNGTPAELQAQIDWLDSLPHKYKIAIAGNHDTWLDPSSRKTLPASDQDGTVDWKSIIYLQDSSATLDYTNRLAIGTKGSLKIYGMPHIPACGGPDFAFQYPRGEDIWTGKIPEDADVVVTHTPAKYHLDLPGGAALGDKFLLREIRRTRPLLHVFGHVHSGRSDVLGLLRRGQEVLRWDESESRFEAIMARQSSDWPVLRVLDIGGWILLVVAIVLGCWNVFRDLSPVSETRSTRLVNASLMYRNTGRLGNRPQVVHL